MDAKEQILAKYDQILDLLDAHGDQAESVWDLMSYTARKYMAESSYKEFQSLKNRVANQSDAETSSKLFDFYHSIATNSETKESIRTGSAGGEILFGCVLEAPHHGYWLWVAEQLVIRGQLNYPGYVSNDFDNALNNLSLKKLKQSDLFKVLSGMAINISEGLETSYLDSLVIEPKILNLLKEEFKALILKMVLMGYEVARIEEPFRNTQNIYRSGI